MISLKKASEMMQKSKAFKKHPKKDFPVLLGAVYHQVKYSSLKNRSYKRIVKERIEEILNRIYVQKVMMEHNLVKYGYVTENEIESHLEWIRKNGGFDMTDEEIISYVEDYVQDDVNAHIYEELSDEWDDKAKERLAQKAFNLIEDGTDLIDAVYEAEKEIGEAERIRIQDEIAWQKAIEEENRETNRWINRGGWHTAYGLPY